MSQPSPPPLQTPSPGPLSLLIHPCPPPPPPPNYLLSPAATPNPKHPLNSTGRNTSLVSRALQPRSSTGAQTPGESRDHALHCRHLLS